MEFRRWSAFILTICAVGLRIDALMTWRVPIQGQNDLMNLYVTFLHAVYRTGPAHGSINL